MKNKVQEFRWQKRLTEEQLAIKAGVHRSTICKLENGRIKNPTVDIAFKVADALEVDVRKLFFW